jgi:hypothetical protein
MSELLAKLEAGHVVAITAILGTLLMIIIAIIGGYWTSARNQAAENMLKHDMIERGMSADEIQKVLQASGTKEPSGIGFVAGRPMSDEAMAARILTSLVSHGVTNDGLALVMPSVHAASLESKEAINNALNELEEAGAEDSEQYLTLVRAMCPAPRQPVVI